MKSFSEKMKVISKERGYGLWMIGKKGNSGSFKKGNIPANYKGGTVEERRKNRNTEEYKSWRTAVFTRDNFRCQWCGIRGVEIHADHIKPYHEFPKLRLSVKNGRTLCVECDRKRTKVQMTVYWKNQFAQSKHRNHAAS